jgi:hypothetical protein
MNWHQITSHLKHSNGNAQAQSGRPTKGYLDAMISVAPLSVR